MKSILLPLALLSTTSCGVEQDVSLGHSHVVSDELFKKVIPAGLDEKAGTLGQLEISGIHVRNNQKSGEKHVALLVYKGTNPCFADLTHIMAYAEAGTIGAVFFQKNDICTMEYNPILKVYPLRLDAAQVASQDWNVVAAGEMGAISLNLKKSTLPVTAHRLVGKPIPYEGVNWSQQKLSLTVQVGSNPCLAQGVEPVVQFLTEDGITKVSVTDNRSKPAKELKCPKNSRPVYKDMEIFLSFPGKSADRVQVL